MPKREQIGERHSGGQNSGRRSALLDEDLPSARRKFSPTAAGCRLYDSQGREYLDFLAGIAVNATGYAHPRMVRVIRREAGRATHVSNLFHNPYQAPLARKLAEWSGLDRVFFANSGSEAIEGALKLARAYAHAQVPPHRSARRRRASSRWKIPFTVAPWELSRLPRQLSIASLSSPLSPESNSSASTTSPTSTPNSTTPFAPSSSSRSRAKAA